jgi:hypothetical protein
MLLPLKQLSLFLFQASNQLSLFSVVLLPQRFKCPDGVFGYFLLFDKVLHQMLSVALELFGDFDEGSIVSLLSREVGVSLPQGLLVFLGFLLEDLLHLHVFLFILD